MSRLKRAFYIDGSKAIFKNHSFWVWMAISAVIALLVLSHKSDVSFYEDLAWFGLGSLTSALSKHWSSVAALLPVYLGLYLAVHRSFALELKNDFDLRFKHEEEYLKYISSIDAKPLTALGLTVKLAPTQKLYSLMFRENIRSVSVFSLTIERALEVLSAADLVIAIKLQQWVKDIQENGVASNDRAQIGIYTDISTVYNVDFYFDNGEKFDPTLDLHAEMLCPQVIEMIIGSSANLYESATQFATPIDPSNTARLLQFRQERAFSRILDQLKDYPIDDFMIGIERTLKKEIIPRKKFLKKPLHK